MRRSAALAAAVAISSLACGCRDEGAHTEAQREEAATAEADLMRADLEFAADARARGAATAFGDRFLADGKLIAGGAPVAVGPDAVRQALAGDSSEWAWAPEEVAVSGNLGVTWGRATITPKNAGGEVIRTRYVTVWKREPGGDWKIWLDLGNREPEPSNG